MPGATISSERSVIISYSFLQLFSRVDPHQLRNLLHTLTDTELNFMHSQVTFTLSKITLQTTVKTSKDCNTENFA